MALRCPEVQLALGSMALRCRHDTLLLQPDHKQVKEPLGKPKRWKQEKFSSPPSPPLCRVVHVYCMSLFTVSLTQYCKNGKLISFKRPKEVTSFSFFQQKPKEYLSFFTKKLQNIERIANLISC